MSIVAVFIGLLAVAKLSAQDPIHLFYDAASGFVRAENPTDSRVVAIEIGSQSGILSGSVDVPVVEYRDNYLFWVVSGGTSGPVELGPIAKPGLTTEFVMSDLCVEVQRTGASRPTFVDLITLNGETLATARANCDWLPDPDRPSKLIPLNERRAVFHYDPSDGSVVVDTNGPTPEGAVAELVALEILSEGGIFTGEPARGVGDSTFDVDRDDKIFKLSIEGFDSINLGPVARPGMTNAEVVSDVCVDGAWLGGGGIRAEYQYPGADLVPMTVCAERSRSRSRDVQVQYTPESGRLRVSIDDMSDEATGNIAAHKAEVMTTLELISKEGIFTGGIAQGLVGPLDEQTPTRIFKQDRDGFTLADFGEVLQPGLSAEFLAQDLQLDVTLLGATRVRSVQFVVPEPTTAWWAASIGLFALRRRTTTLCDGKDDSRCRQGSGKV